MLIRKMAVLSFFAFVFSLAAHASVSDAVVKISDGKILDGVKYIAAKQTQSDLTLMGFTVGTSTLSDVQTKFQDTTIYHQGDAGDSIYVLCYLGDDGTTLAFESDGEMGGDDHVLTSVQVFGPKNNYAFKEQCAKSPSVSQEIEVGGVKLGMTKASMKKLKGSPSKELRALLLYDYAVKEKTARGDADLDSSLELHFDHDKVSHFTLSKSETL